MEKEIYPITVHKNVNGDFEVWYYDDSGRSQARASSTRINKIPLFKWCQATLTPEYNYGSAQTSQFQIERISEIQGRVDPELRWILIDMDGWPRFKIRSKIREGFSDEVNEDALFKAIKYYDPDIIVITTRTRRGLEAAALDHAKDLAELGRDGKGSMIRGWGLPRLNGRLVIDPLEISHLIGFYDDLNETTAEEIIDAIKFLVSITSSYNFLLYSNFSGIASLISKYKHADTPFIKTGLYEGRFNDCIDLQEKDRWLINSAKSKIRLKILVNLAESFQSSTTETDPNAMYKYGARTITNNESGFKVFSYDKLLLGRKEKEWAALKGGELFAAFQSGNPYYSPVSRKLQRNILLKALSEGPEGAKSVVEEENPQELNPFYLIVEREVRVEGNLVRRKGVLMLDGSLKPPLWVNPALDGVNLDVYTKERQAVSAQVISIWEQTRLGDFNRP